MKNIILWIIVGVVVIGGAVLLSNNKSNSSDKEISSSSSSLVVSETSYDFGEIGIFEGKVKNDFTITNTGTEAVTILNGTTSCACTEGVIDGVVFGMHDGMTKPVSIDPGESKVLTAIYDPLAHGPNGTGQVTRQLFLKTNSTETSELEVRISADVVKEIN